MTERTPGGAAASFPAGLRALVFVSRVDEELDRAMRYLADLGADSVRAVHLGRADAGLGASFWARYGRALEFVERGQRAARRARTVVRAECAAAPDHVLAVLVPGSAAVRRRFAGRPERRLQAGLLGESGVMLVNL